MEAKQHRCGSNAASRILLITGRARSSFSLAVALAASKRSGKLHRSSASRRPAVTFEYAISRRLCIGMLLEWPKVCQFRHMGSASRASRRGHLSDVRGSQLGAHRCEPGQCHRVRGHVEHVFRHWRSRGFHRVPIGLSVGSVSWAWTFANLRGRADRSVTEGNRLFWQKLSATAPHGGS